MVHVVVDAVAVRPGSTAVILENMLGAWVAAYPEDRVSVIATEKPGFVLPEGANLVALDPPVGGPAGQAWLRTIGVRRAARRLGADIALSGVPASGLLGTGCPRGIILCDLRHELRPDQFSAKRRLARRVAWGWNMRRVDGIFCISHRTLDDLARQHPGWADRGVAARCGADHVDGWPAAQEAATPYALAFGQFANKNVPAVLEGWARFCATDDQMTLRLVGMSRADRADATAQVARLGIEDRVELMPWLDDDAFIACFAGASMVVFPSDFEGFGLPAVEALRLRIPVVVSADEALAEVTGGHAVVTRSTAPDAMADAMRAALATGAPEREAGSAYTDRFTWAGMADAIREGLVGVAQPGKR